MSPKRAPRASSAKRVPYRAPRDRRELWTAVAVGCLILIVTASFVWFLRPNRESASSGKNPGVTFHTVPTTPPTEATTPTDTTPATTPTEDTTAPAGG